MCSVVQCLDLITDGCTFDIIFVEKTMSTESTVNIDILYKQSHNILNKHKYLQ